MEPQLGKELLVLDPQTLMQPTRRLRLALSLVQNVGSCARDHEDQQHRKQEGH
jgi:hypothetical protein